MHLLMDKKYLKVLKKVTLKNKLNKKVLNNT